jgi:hypothetical protein
VQVFVVCFKSRFVDQCCQLGLTWQLEVSARTLFGLLLVSTNRKKKERKGSEWGQVAKKRGGGAFGLTGVNSPLRPR